MSEPQYYDIDGKPCSLETLCAKEPGWAASRIRHMRLELEAALAERDRRVTELEAELAGAKSMLAGVRNHLKRIALPQRPQDGDKEER